jgi:hypothetical protein
LAADGRNGQVGDEGAAPAIEEIPNDDTVSRLVDFPHKYSEDRELIWESIFAFTKSRGQYTGESVNWSKYCATPDAIHALGCEWQRKKRERVPTTRYVGYTVGGVGNVRGVNNRRGHSFQVIHDPLDNQGQHHAEIRYLRCSGPEVPFESSDREELKFALQRQFGPLVPHECDD